MTVRTLIVDDEAVARRRVRRLLGAEADVEIVGEAGDGISALSMIEQSRPDLVLLDVQMPEVDGFEIVRRLPPGAVPSVIFVTAFDRYALQAFDVCAIDYLLKPFTRERFALAVQRARDRLRSRRADAGLEALVANLRVRPQYLSRLAVRAGTRIVLLDVEAIDWIQAADNYVTLHASGREYLLRESLSVLERQLDPSRFARIHRSTIVNVGRVAELAAATHGDFDVRLRDGTRLVLSRTWRERVEQALGRRL